MDLEKEESYFDENNLEESITTKILENEKIKSLQRKLSEKVEEEEGFLVRSKPV